ncbi:DUF1501 domain-containing protein [Schlesneria sp. DSM 10557]|uniref:DUF1501 domain-containing protein n=1 Tax=Schlesneria sp. DSM 10557 TaxID=3044399 RepID=UPI0035A00629
MKSLDQALGQCTRRGLLQAGYSGLFGVGLTSILAGREKAAAAAEGSSNQKPKSVLLVFLSGAMSHIDTFDMKPEAPQEIRGEFKPIATSIPGYSICEHLPQLASRAHKYAVVRSFSHDDNNHTQSAHHITTGEKQPGGFFDKSASREDWPHYAAALSYLQRAPEGLPCGVTLPNFLQAGPLVWPGQLAGFLGASHDPWFVNGDPSHPDFRVTELTLAQGIDAAHLERRLSLLDEVNRQQRTFDDIGQSRLLQKSQHMAYDLLTSSRLTQAFDMKKIPDSVRDQYGRNIGGQSLLVGRRLIEAGVPIVQVNLNGWDTHDNNCEGLKNHLLPPFDQGISALLDDMESSGLLQETLVVVVSEFGRTPKINGTKGRDHWGPCFFGLFAGAGVQGGQVIGRSDATASYPTSRRYTPNDIGATIYQALGVPLETEVHDRLGRRVRLNTGEVIEPLFTGGSV